MAQSRYLRGKDDLVKEHTNAIVLDPTPQASSGTNSEYEQPFEKGSKTSKG